MCVSEFAILTLNLDKTVNGSRLSFVQVNTHAGAHKHSHKHRQTHVQTHKALHFPEPQSAGLGTSDLVIISRVVHFDLLLMSVFELSHL